MNEQHKFVLSQSTSAIAEGNQGSGNTPATATRKQPSRKAKSPKDQVSTSTVTIDTEQTKNDIDASTKGVTSIITTALPTITSNNAPAKLPKALSINAEKNIVKVTVASSKQTSSSDQSSTSSDSTTKLQPINNNVQQIDFETASYRTLFGDDSDTDTTKLCRTSRKQKTVDYTEPTIEIDPGQQTLNEIIDVGEDNRVLYNPE